MNDRQPTLAGLGRCLLLALACIIAAAIGSCIATQKLNSLESHRQTPEFSQPTKW